MSFQKMILCGEVVTEPELRYTQNGVPCCAFRLKTVETWPGRDGQVREEAEEHRIIVWGADGEKASKELKKGQTALVEGKNKTRKWKSENNHEVDITEVIAIPGGVKPLGGGPAPEGEPAARQRPIQAAPQNKAAPAENAAIAKAAPVAAAGKSAKAAPVKPLPAKPEKVHVDLVKAHEEDDLPF